MISTQAPIRVLHVDDDPSFTDLTVEFLKRENDRFIIETANSADEGLQRITDRPPDCIVSDYDMPGMNGIEFLEAIRDDHPEVPFILFTGKGSEEVASDALSTGATDYIQKQSGAERYELLANRIENAVEQYRSEQRLRETREEYAAVFENAQNGLLLIQVDDDGFRYQRCNPRAVELIGRDEGDIIAILRRKRLGRRTERRWLVRTASASSNAHLSRTRSRLTCPWARSSSNVKSLPLLRTATSNNWSWSSGMSPNSASISGNLKNTRRSLRHSTTRCT